MIRILHVVNDMHRAGLETMLMNYYRNIDRTKIQFDFLTHRPEKSDYDDEIIAMGVYAKKGYDKGNYGYDIELKGEELLNVGQIESTVVREEYRGNKLQRIICEELEKIAIENNTKIVCATASPYNEFSVNTFKSLGYEIKKDKIKYGGLRRYVLVKEL